MDWTALITNMYGLISFLLTAIIPILLLMLMIRIFARSARKTINVFKK